MEYKPRYTTHPRVLSSLQDDHLNSIYETAPSAHGGQKDGHGLWKQKGEIASRMRKRRRITSASA